MKVDPIFFFKALLGRDIFGVQLEFKILIISFFFESEFSVKEKLYRFSDTIEDKLG